MGVEFLEHLVREQREARAKNRAHHRIRTERGPREKEVAVDDVVEQREEDPDDGEPERCTCHHRRPEAHGRVRRPAEPEDGACECGSSEHRLLETNLWGDGVRGMQARGAFVPGIPYEEVRYHSSNCATEDREEHETGNASIEMVP